MKTRGFRRKDLADLHLLLQDPGNHPFQAFRMQLRVKNKLEKRIVGDL